jgi:hypothetical protein
MATDDEYSKTPSGLNSDKKTSKSILKQKNMHMIAPSFSASFIISVIALIIALAALAISLDSGGLGTDEKTALKEVTENLRLIQEKSIPLKTPLKTTVYIDKSIPLSEIFTDDILLQVNGSLPIKKEFVAQSEAHVATFKIDDDFHFEGELPLSSRVAFEGTNLNIRQEIPIDTEMSVNLKIKTVYGKEFHNMITKLEQIAED